MTTAASTFGILYSSGKNIELQNKQLADAVMSDQINLSQQMLNLLYLKMADDQAKARKLSDQLALQQTVARNVKNPDSDSKDQAEFISFDGSQTPPFDGWTVVSVSAMSTAPSILPGVNTWDALKDKKHEATGMTYAQLAEAGAVVWTHPEGEKVSGKQVFQYYEKEADRIKAAISSLTTLASQDNYTVQRHQNGVSELTTLLSTLEKKRHDLVESVQQNVGR